MPDIKYAVYSCLLNARLAYSASRRATENYCALAHLWFLGFINIEHAQGAMRGRRQENPAILCGDEN